MAEKKYLTAPVPSKKVPKGIPYILSNEMAERFAFYGMTAILVLYMTTQLNGPDGTLDLMGETEAMRWFHLFKSAVYFLPCRAQLLLVLYRNNDSYGGHLHLCRRRLPRENLHPGREAA